MGVGPRSGTIRQHVHGRRCKSRGSWPSLGRRICSRETLSAHDALPFHRARRAATQAGALTECRGTLLTLFRISTGDAWGDVMTSLQLASGDRAAPISDDVWVYYGALLEQDVADVQADMNVLSKDETNNLFLKQPENGRIRLKMAEKALSKWNFRG